MSGEVRNRLSFGSLADHLGDVDGVAVRIHGFDQSQIGQESLAPGQFGREGPELVRLSRRLDELVGLHPVGLRLLDEEVEELVLLHVDVEAFREDVQEKLVAHEPLCLLAGLGGVRVVRFLALLFEVPGDLLLHGGFGEREVDCLAKLLEEQVACGVHLGARLVLGQLPAQIRTQLVDRVELGGELGEVVVGLGELGLLDVPDRDGDVGRLAGVVPARESRGEGDRLPRLLAGQGVVETLKHGSRADAIGDARHRVDFLAVDSRGEVDRRVVAALGGALDLLERAEAFAQGGEPGVDVLVGDIEPVDRDRDRRGIRYGDLGADVDCHDEDEVGGVVLLSGNLCDLYRWPGHGVQLVRADGLSVVAVQVAVERLLDDGAAAESSFDDAGRDVTAAESRNVDLLADVFGGIVDRGLELLERHLNGQLDLGGLEGLDGALHWGFSLSYQGADSPPVFVPAPVHS